MGRRRLLVLGLLAAAFVATGVSQSAASASEPQQLFALDSRQGELLPLKGKPGYFNLVLEHVRPLALYFTDRPARKVGRVAVAPMFRELFAAHSPPPNAAVNANVAKHGQVLMGIEIRGWHYDRTAGTLTLRVRHLPHGGRTISHVVQDTVLPHSFDNVSLFIDDCCSVVSQGTVFDPSVQGLFVSVNNGAPIAVPGASTETWLPGSASIGVTTAFTRPGVLGPGSNYVFVTPVGGGAPIAFPVILPRLQPNANLQLYLFLGRSSLNWTVLSSGQLIGSGAVSPGGR